MENKQVPDEERKINRLIKQRTVISFTVFILLIIGAVICWNWFNNSPEDNGALRPLRKVLTANEDIGRKLFKNRNLAKEYPKSKAENKVRVNGDIGMGDEFDANKWHLIIMRHPDCASKDSILELSLEDVKGFPKKDLVFDFKCIEGWSQITYWGGTRFIDFLMKYHLGTHSGRSIDINHPEDIYNYVGMMTPDSSYYVGIDMLSAMHPQTLLCYEMNGAALPMNQGFPLRLIIPLKYGVKNIKRIGYIYFSDSKPKDYWYEQGYEYDASL